MTKRLPGIKVQPFNELQYPEPDGQRCIIVFVPDDPAFVPLLAGMVHLATKGFNYARQDYDKAQRLAYLWKLAYDRTDWESCMNCAELLECITPLFDALNERLDTIEAEVIEVVEVVEEISEVTEANVATPPPDIEYPATNQRCAGAQGVVQFMHDKNMAEYAAAESGIFDTLMEAYIALVGIFPKLAGWDADELMQLTNTYFSNQAAAYEASYDVVKDDLVEYLYCEISRNGGNFNFDIWGDWLTRVGIFIPSEPAAQLFSRYRPAAFTFANQIAAFFNNDISLQSYFEDIYNAYGQGFVATSSACSSVDCGSEWCKEWDFTIDDGGWQAYGGHGTYVPGVGWLAPSDTVLWLYREDLGGNKILNATFSVEGEESTIQLGTPYDTLTVFQTGNYGFFPFIDTSGNPGFDITMSLAVRAGIDGIQEWDGIAKTLELCGFGYEPDWDA